MIQKIRSTANISILLFTAVKIGAYLIKIGLCYRKKSTKVVSEQEKIEVIEIEISMLTSIHRRH